MTGRSPIVRVLHFSPGTATGRHDGHRAALGFLAFLREAAVAAAPELRSELVWALPAIGSRPDVHRLLSEVDLLVIVTPTYGQGSPWFLRKFFEQTRGLGLWGVLATVIATSGGQHTGGEMAVMDSMRSLQGAGACTFTFAQKLLVLGTQQRETAEGMFEPADAWFLRQLARTCVVQWLCRRHGPGTGPARRLGVDTGYYLYFPDRHRLVSETGDILRHMNAPLEDPATYGWWTERLGFEARPPDASGLPFAALLPQPESGTA
jgi:flavodoxin